VDTTIIISALIKRDAASSRAVLELDHDYYSIDVLIREVHTHLPKIWENSQLDPYEFIDVFLGMLRKMKIASLSLIPKTQRAKAREIIERRDPKDEPFVALMLTVGAEGILSYDEDFEEVEKHGYKRYTPEELLRKSRSEEL